MCVWIHKLIFFIPQIFFSLVYKFDCFLTQISLWCLIIFFQICEKIFCSSIVINVLHNILYTIIHFIIIIYFAALSNSEVIRFNFLSFLSFLFLGKFMHCTFKLPIKKIKTTVFFCLNGHDNVFQMLYFFVCVYIYICVVCI